MKVKLLGRLGPKLLGETSYDFAVDGRTYRYRPTSPLHPSITFQSNGGALIELAVAYGAVCWVKVNGLRIDSYEDTAKIEEPKLRVAVEQGLDAWLVEQKIVWARNKQLKADALKSL